MASPHPPQTTSMKSSALRLAASSCIDALERCQSPLVLDRSARPPPLPLPLVLACAGEEGAASRSWAWAWSEEGEDEEVWYGCGLLEGCEEWGWRCEEEEDATAAMAS